MLPPIVSTPPLGVILQSIDNPLELQMSISVILRLVITLNVEKGIDTDYETIERMNNGN